MGMVTPVANPPDDKPASVAELRKQISLALEQRLTGLAKVVLLSGEEVTMVVSRGGVRQVYYKDGSVSRVLPNFWLSQQLSDKQARLSIQSLPARRLLFEKILLESNETVQEKKQGFRTAVLAQLFSSMKDCEAGSLVHIRWKDAEAFVLVPGSKLALRLALFLSGDIVEEDAFAISSIENWKESNCDLTIYRGSIESEAWLEAHLDILFESFCSYLLTQYGYLTGRVMITSIIQNLMILASQKGWELDRLGNTVVDRTIFASPKEAAAAYQELLEMALAHMGAVIGSALARSLIQQGLDTYNTFYQSLIKTYELI
jgi:hypothetical protein